MKRVMTAGAALLVAVPASVATDAVTNLFLT
jgi:hypothetical protein